MRKAEVVLRVWQSYKAEATLKSIDSKRKRVFWEILGQNFFEEHFANAVRYQQL